MKKLILFLALILIPSHAFAAQRATLQNGSGDEVGTSGNPLKVSVSGNVSASDATFTALEVTGTIHDTKIGTYGAEDATFASLTTNDVTFGAVQGTPLCWSAAGQVCICGSCA